MRIQLFRKQKRKNKRERGTIYKYTVLKAKSLRDLEENCREQAEMLYYRLTKIWSGGNHVEEEILCQ